MARPPSNGQGGFRAASADGALIYAVGDIHGRYDLLTLLLARLAQDRIATAGDRRPALVFLGDYVDRGPDSAKVIEALTYIDDLGHYDLHFLMGNHERTMLDFLGEPTVARHWMRFGGAQTLASYGVAPPSADALPAAFDAAREALVRNLPEAHLTFLQRLGRMVMIGDYLFVHAGVRPGRPMDEQGEEDLLWIRREFLDHSGPFEKVIVHGHTWVDEQPRLLSHRIGVDTGAYLTGVLTAVRIEDGDLRLIQARGEPAATDYEMEEGQVALQSR